MPCSSHLFLIKIQKYTPEKRVSFKKMMFGRLIIYMQKNETKSLSITLHKHSVLNGSKIPNVRPETLRFLEKTTWSTIQDICIGEQLLRKQDQLLTNEVYAVMKLYTAKEIVNRVKQPIEWEKTFAGCTSDRGLILKYAEKEFIKLNTK